MNSNKFSWLIFVLGLLLSLYYIDWQPNWNNVSRAALPLSLALNGTLEIDEYADYTGDNATVNGKAISDKAPLPGLIMTPIVKVVDWLHSLDRYGPEDRLKIVIFIGSVLFGSLPMALMLLLAYRSRLDKTPERVILLFVAFFGSFLFVFSGSFGSHIFTAFLLVWSFRLIESSKFVYAGLVMGACFMSEYNMAIFGAVWGIYFIVRGQWKALLLFSAGVVPFILLQGWYNHATTGSVLELAYRYQENFQQNADAYGFGYPSIEAFYHLSISQYRGILFYAPLLILVIIFLFIRRKTRQRNFLDQMALFSCLIYFIAFTCNQSWYGGWTYGPRYLAGISALLFYVYLNRIDLRIKWVKILFVVLGAFGLIQAFLDKATILYPKTSMRFPLLDGIVPALIDGNYNNRNILGLFGVEGLLPHVVFWTMFTGVAWLLYKKAYSVSE